jgi:hypothetical protein
MRDYGKVHTSFWTSANIRDLSEDGRLFALYLLTCPHGTIAGVFRLPDGYVCEDLKWSSERVNETLAELFSNGFATRCNATKWIFVIKHLEWNPPENPNQKKAALKMVDQIPDSCSWKVDFIEKNRDLFNLWKSGKSKPLPKGSKRVLKPVTVTVTGDIGPKGPSSSVKPPTCPVDKIVEVYNATLPEMAAAKVLDDARVKAIRERWNWVFTTFKPDGTRRAETPEQAEEWFKSYFERARDNAFLMGKTAKSGEHINWKCDIDFLMTTKGLKQVIEKSEVTA